MKQIDVVKVKRWDNELITAEIITINDDLSDFYEQIECSTIDIVERVLNGRYFDIILNDEALLDGTADKFAPTSWWQGEGYTPNHEGLWGTLLLCHHDNEGNLTSATIDDLEIVHSSFRTISLKDGGDLVLLFHDIEKEWERG